MPAYRGIKDVLKTMIIELVENFYILLTNSSNNLNPSILKNQVINLETLFTKILSVIPGSSFWTNRAESYSIG